MTDSTGPMTEGERWEDGPRECEYHDLLQPGGDCSCGSARRAATPERQKKARPHVPTPQELDDLLAAVSACGYASEAVQVVEDWTRKWWGVESAFTTHWAAQRKGRAG
jgi:hypothetical protein